MLEIEDLVVDRASGQRRFRLEVPFFRLGPAQVVSLVGPSGSGKSTLLDVLSMVLMPTRVSRFVISTKAGETLDLADLIRRGLYRRLDHLRAQNIGYVLQTGGLLPFLSAEANVSLTGRLSGLRAREARARARSLGEQLGVARLLKDRPARLSVGERQRVAIARALCHGPGLVLADEPTAALDKVIGDRVLRLFLDLVGGTQSSLVVASHDTALLDRFGLPKADYRLEEMGPDQVRATFSFEGAA